MKDLSKVSALPLALDEHTSQLHFSGDLPAVTPAVRRLEELRPVLMNPTATGPDEVYWMYREVVRPEDQAVFQRMGVRYDITVLSPGRIGGEFVKTLGHYHPLVPGATVTYPEVYEVLHGTAHYLLQKPANGRDLADIVIIEAEAGDKVLIPPGYGHITINMGRTPLVMGNLVARDFASRYEPYLQLQGGAYYAVREGGEETLVWNQRYGQAPELRMLPPEEHPELGVKHAQPLYAAAVADPDRFRYLNHPQEYGDQLALPDLDEWTEEDEEED